MDYEKAYKKALERARNLHKDAIDMGENLRAKQCEIIFPELVETEDERVRKAIIKSFPKYGYLPQTSIKVEDAIVWLEKQGEKPTNKIEIPDFKEQNREHLEALKEMMASMDISKQDDHRAEIAEREYWRKLRGDLILKLIDYNNFKDTSIIERINEIVDDLILTDKN